MAQVTFKLKNTAQVSKKLNQVAQDISDFSEPFEKAGDKMLKRFGEDVFESEGGAIGDDWRDLSPATLRARQNREGYYSNSPTETGQPMVWTGRLKKGFRKDVSKTRLVIDNPVEYFKYHQLPGGTNPPQRKLMGLTKDVITDVMTEVNKYAVKTLNK